MNTGYIPAVHLPEHPVFGGVASENNPSADWRQWKAPEEDNQNVGVEPMDCTAEARVRSFEITVRKLFNDQRSWSARYLAFISGTTAQGNDPFKVSEVFRTQGTVLETLWPNTADLKTFDDFYATPPANFREEALLLTAEYAISPSQWVQPDKDSIRAALTHCPLRAAGFAWVQDSNGLYYTPPGTLPDHDFVILAAVLDPNAVNGVRYFVDDSYMKDGTDIKELRGDYQFVDIQMDTVSKNVANTPQAQSAWQAFLAWMSVVFQQTLGLGDYHPDKLGGKERSPEWPIIVAEFAKYVPKVCPMDGLKKVQLHHSKWPFHTNPTEELNPMQLRWACEGLGTHNHHIQEGHNGNFQSINLSFDERIEQFQHRPLWNGTEWIPSNAYPIKYKLTESDLAEWNAKFGTKWEYV